MSRVTLCSTEDKAALLDILRIRKDGIYIDIITFMNIVARYGQQIKKKIPQLTRSTENSLSLMLE